MMQKLTMEALLIKAVRKGALSEVRRLVEEEQVDPKRWVAGHEWTPLHWCCVYGHLSVVRYLVREVDEGKRCDPQCVDDDGNTPLHVACAFGRLRVVTYLTETFPYRVNRTNKDGMTPLHLATMRRHVEVVKHLVENCKADPSCVDSSGKTPLFFAIEKRGHVSVQKCLEIAEYLLLECNCIMDDVAGSKSLLIWACQEGMINMVKYCIETCLLNPNFSCENGKTLLSCAIKSKQWETAKYLLLECQCKPSRKDGEQLLLWACNNNCIEVVQYLNLRCYEDGSTPLHWAVEWGVLKDIRFLIENCKSDANRADRNGITPIHLAMELSLVRKCKRYFESLEYLLLECICKITDLESVKPLLLLACENGRTSLVKYLADVCKLKDQIPIFNDQRDKTLLSSAIERNNWETAKYLLLECQCKPSRKDGEDLLLWACDNNCIEVVQYLNDPSFYEDGSTPLHWAVQWGDFDNVKFIIETSKADPSCDALQLAVEKGDQLSVQGNDFYLYLEIAEYLILECKCTVDNVEDSKLLLTWACEEGWTNLVKYFITECQLDPKFKDKFGKTPLNYAVLRKKWETAKYLLLECQCKPSRKDGEDLLLWACNNNCVEVVQYLNDPSFYEDGSTPLHWAVQWGDLKSVKYLIRDCKVCVDSNDIFSLDLIITKCNLCVQDYSQYIKIAEYLVLECKSCGLDEYKMILQWACEKGALNVVKHLNKTCKLDFNAKNEKGKTPLSIAIKRKHWAVVRYLIFNCQCKPSFQDGKDLLLWTSDHDCFELVKCLNDPSCYEGGNSLLHWAVQWGVMRNVKCLVEQCNFDPKLTNENGLTPLNVAVKKKIWEAAKYLLLKCHCKPSIADQTALLNWAYKKDHIESDVVAYLNDPNFCEDGSTQLHWAVQCGVLANLKFMIENSNADPNCIDSNGKTPLHLAIEKGKELFLHQSNFFEIAEYLLCQQRLKLDEPEHGEPVILWACEEGKTNLLKYLTENCNLDPKFVNQNGKTPLRCSIGGENWETAKYLLLQCQCKPSRKDGEELLLWACNNNCIEVVQYLNDPSFYEDGSTPLHWAVQWGVLENVELILETCKADPNYADDNGKTPLHLAIEKGNQFSFHKSKYFEIAEYLLLKYHYSNHELEHSKPSACEEGQSNLSKYLNDPISMDLNEGTPLSCAIARNKWGTVKYLLLECQCKPSCKDGKDVLLWACNNNCVEVVQYLNDPSFYEDGSTPLHWAVHQGSLRNVKFVVETCKADPNCVDSNGKSPLDLAIEKGNYGYHIPTNKYFEVAEYLLLEYNCNIDDDRANKSLLLFILWVSFTEGKTNLLKYLNETCKVDFNFKHERDTPLSCAIERNNWETAKYLLLECKCKPSHKVTKDLLKWSCNNNCVEVVQYLNDPSFYEDRSTPLHWAVHQGSLRKVKFVIETCKSDPNCVNSNGKTPLDLAIEKGNHLFGYQIPTNKYFEVAEYFLLEYNCNIDDDRAKKSLLLLWVSCTEGKTNLLKYLSETCKLDFNFKHERGTPLSCAIKKNNWETAKYLLLKCKCKPSHEDIEDLLKWSCNNNCVEVVEYFNDPSFCENGTTLLHWAVERSSIKCTKFMVECCNLDPNCEDINGSTPLHLAITMMELEIVNYFFLECKYKTDLKSGNFALLLSCKKGWKGILMYLIEDCNHDPNFEDENGKTLLNISIENERWAIAEYLVLQCHCKPAFKDGSDLMIWACKAINDHMFLVKYLNNPSFCNWSDKSNTRLFAILQFDILKYIKITSLSSVNDFLQLSSRMGWKIVLTHLVEVVGCDPRSKNLLSIAVENQKWKIVKYLILRCSCKPTLRDMKAILIWACESDCMEIVQYLIDNNFLNNFLHWTVLWGDLRCVKYIIEECKYDLTYVDSREKPLLHLAIEKGSQKDCKKYFEIAEYLLLECKCDMIQNNHYNCKPFLLWAYEEQKLNLIKHLVDNCKLDPNFMSEDGRNPLDCVITRRNWPLAKSLLLEHHCKPTTENAKVLLSLACENEYTDMSIVKHLVEFYDVDPTSVDANENIPLQVAILKHNWEAINYFILERQCLLNEDYEVALVYNACIYGHMDILEHLLIQCRFDLQYVGTLLDLQISDDFGNKELIKHVLCQKACTEGKPDTLKRLVESYGCDSQFVDEMGRTLLHLACKQGHTEIAQYLIETCKSDPNRMDLKGNSPLHYAAEECHIETIKCLVKSGNSNIRCANKEGRIPLHLASVKGHKEVMKYMIKNCHISPNCVDDSGCTPLHMTVVFNHIRALSYLIEEGSCDLNFRTKEGDTPLELAVEKPDIARMLVKAGASLTAKPQQPCVKVFIVGNPSTGKSSLTKALQRETTALGATFSPITGPQMVKDVQPMTAGIALSHFSSKRYGRVILYDMAGQQEYYASHAALLQNAISSYAPLFIIVVNLCDSEDEIKQKIIYWISFLTNQCKTSLTTKPHIIIVGSHKDIVKSRGEEPMEKVNIQLLESDPLLSGFSFSKFIPIDCRQTNSLAIVKLVETMKEACNTLRKQLGVAYHLHHLFSFLMKHFGEVVAVTFRSVFAIIQQECNTVVTSKKDELYCDLCELSDRGEIIFLVNHKDVAKSWIILNQPLLISDINGVLFAPEGFKQHCKFADVTGVVAVTKLSKRFPQYKSDMLVQFLTLLEFCCEVKDKEALQLIDQERSTLTETDPTFSDQYLLFPALISADVSSDVWKVEAEFTHTCGWMLQCSDDRQLLTSQFLQVLLLRIAFSCALAADDRETGGIPVLRRKCTIWKSGIYWSNRDGIEVLVEIRHPPQNKEVLVMLRCRSGQEVECAHLRSTIIQMVLKAKEKLSHNVPTKEFVIHPTQLTYPCNHINDKHLFNIMEISEAVIEGKPYVVDVTGKSTEMNKILLFEPYSNLGLNILHQLFNENSNDTVSIEFLYKVAERVHNKKDLFIDMLKPSQLQLDKKIRQAPPGRCEEFVCVLQCWRGDSGTYQSLREKLDHFSVFAGRNPLVSSPGPCVWHI